MPHTSCVTSLTLRLLRRSQFLAHGVWGEDFITEYMRGTWYGSGPGGPSLYNSSSALKPGEEMEFAQGPTGTGLPADPRLLSFPYNLIPLSSSQLWCWRQGLRTRACLQKFSCLCPFPFLPAPDPYSLVPGTPRHRCWTTMSGLWPDCLSCQKLSPRKQLLSQTPGCADPSNDRVSDSCQTHHGCSWYSDPDGSREHTCSSWVSCG